jgi:hypothetical protein
VASPLVDSIVQQGNQLFGKQGPFLSLLQEIADNFYPQRADFTTVRSMGADLAKGLSTSYPTIVHRDLGNAIGAMLRPSAKDWFRIGTYDPEREDTDAKQWLERVAKTMKRAMYDRASQFTRATKEGDLDFAAFGQAVISTEVNAEGSGFLYRCWHLRDVAWAEDMQGTISTVHRKWKPTARDLVRLFPATVHENVRKLVEKTPYAEINVRHVVLRAEDYATLPNAKKMRTPWVSIFIDVDHHTELECTGSWTKIYTIPRWQTVSGSQYAYSPATVAALPDARLLQAMTLTLLTAGEKAVNPPMVSVQEAIRGDIAIYAGGVTWVDAEYDERLGEVLRPLSTDKTGLAFGLDSQRDIRSQLADAFYLSKLNMPPVTGREMTAYEVGQRVQEFIRNTLPLFEPMEVDYNGGLCEDTFELLMHNYPALRDSAPKGLAGADVQFHFESPLHEASEKIKVGQLMEASQVLATAMQLDPSVALIVDNTIATRDTLSAVIPAKWMRTEAAVEELKQAQQQQQQASQLLEMMQKGAEVAKTVRDATPTAGLGGAEL